MDVEALARESHVNPFRTGCEASLQVRNLFMDNGGGGGGIAVMEMSAGLSVSSMRTFVNVKKILFSIVSST